MHYIQSVESGIHELGVRSFVGTDLEEHVIGRCMQLSCEMEFFGPWEWATTSEMDICW